MTTAPSIPDPKRAATRSATIPPMLCPITVGGVAIPASSATASTSRAHPSRLYEGRRPLSPCPERSIATTRLSLASNGPMWSQPRGRR
jgi:hypothetical protein